RCVRQRFQNVERAAESQLPDRHQPGDRGPGAVAPAARTAANEPPRSRNADRGIRSRRWTAGGDEPEARGDDAESARARRAEPGGRREATGGRIVGYVSPVPGAARLDPSA